MLLNNGYHLSDEILFSHTVYSSKFMKICRSPSAKRVCHCVIVSFEEHLFYLVLWVPINCSLTVNDGVASLIAWLDHSCQKTEVGGKQGHAPCRRILLQ